MNTFTYFFQLNALDVKIGVSLFPFFVAAQP